MAALKRALFLDRDGVINVDIGYLHRAEQCEFVPGIFELVRAARRAGYDVFVVTNQAGIARGYYDEAVFAEFTGWMLERFRITRRRGWSPTSRCATAASPSQECCCERRPNTRSTSRAPS